MAVIILLSDLELTKIEANSAKSSNAHSVEVSYVHNYKVLKQIAGLLCVNEDELIQVLLANSSQAGQKGSLFPKSWEESVSTRDALAKTLYNRLFGWLVKSVNSSMNSEDFK